jgi:hypothetical protein
MSGEPPRNCRDHKNGGELEICDGLIPGIQNLDMGARNVESYRRADKYSRVRVLCHFPGLCFWER